jgi:hypothetical protein
MSPRAAGMKRKRLLRGGNGGASLRRSGPTLVCSNHRRRVVSRLALFLIHAPSMVPCWTLGFEAGPEQHFCSKILI